MIIFPHSNNYIKYIDDREMKIGEDKNYELIMYIMMKRIYVCIYVSISLMKPFRFFHVLTLLRTYFTKQRIKKRKKGEC